MSDKIMDVLAKQTGGRSYKAHKYTIDHAERPSIDYGEDNAVWDKMAETNPSKGYVPLYDLSRCLLEYKENRISYFLDGSRRVYKVDDIAYKKGSRTAIYPVIAGQIGIGCCKRVNKKKFQNFSCVNGI